MKGEIRTHEPVGEWGYGPSALTRLAYPHTLVATKRVALLVVMGLGHLRLLLRHAAIVDSCNAYELPCESCASATCALRPNRCRFRHTLDDHELNDNTSFSLLT